MATFYFNGAADIAAEEPLTNWQTLGNWWTNAEHTIPATGLPTSSDSVIATTSIWTNSGSAPTVVNLTVTSTEYIYLDIPITVTGHATLTTTINSNTITGNATFSNGWNDQNGAVTGNATFNDGSYNGGTVTGDATFNDNSYNNYNGTVTGNGTFNNSSFNNDTVTGNGTFNDNSYTNGVVAGNATFNDNSYNNGSVDSNATFNHNSYNANTVTGNATFTASSFGGNTGIPTDPVYNVVGTVTFSSATPVTFTLNDYNWQADTSSWVFSTAGQKWIVNGSSSLYTSINGASIFNGTPSLNGVGVTGAATFSVAAAAYYISSGGYGTYGSVTIAYEKGINGSSILGVV
jgi:hypothetical protein